MILRALIAALGVCIVALAGQTYRLDRAQNALTELQESITTAAQKSELRAATTAVEAVSNYVQANERDAPIVARVTERVRNVCVREQADDRLPVPAAPAGAGPAGSKAQDDADRAAFLGAVADDLETCVSELNRLDAIRNFHNANTGAMR